MCERIWRAVSPVGGKITWTRSRQVGHVNRETLKSPGREFSRQFDSEQANFRVAVNRERPR
jgi:hypothetical protein